MSPVTVIDKIKQKNAQTFKIYDAVDVEVDNSGFTGNLAGVDEDAQSMFDAVDALTVSAETFSGEADADIVEGNIVYVKASGHVALAKADAAGTAHAAGLATSDALTGFSCAYTADGKIELADWTSILGSQYLTPGSTYYLSPDAAGILTAIAPTSSGHYVVRVGRAASSTVLIIEIAPPILL